MPSYLRPLVSLAFVLALLIVVPLLLQPKRTGADPSSRRLIVITPHNEQIRFEFGRGFDLWHRAKYGSSVTIEWRTPGGTSEIRRQLIAEYEAAARDGRLALMNYDLLFGGGSFEHAQIAQSRTMTDALGATGSYTISEPVDFPAQMLSEWYGENRIGRNTLYDPNRHWFGTALSGFGIVFNRDVLAAHDLPPPTTWDDLANPRLAGLIALADPTRSGSVATTFEVILQREGWVEGWTMLRAASANSRYFSDSASKVVIDVSAGEAAIGTCIDFYGRLQTQSLADAGYDRLGYVDPPGLSDIDPDPVSLLTGAPHRDLALRFIEFCLSADGQALWQFPRRSADKELGPERFELRRLPIRRMMYSQYSGNFIDRVDPFALARPVESWSPDYRAVLTVLFPAMVLDTHDDLRAAWSVLGRARAADHPALAKMESLFIEFPKVTLADGSMVSLAETSSLPLLRARWKETPALRDADRRDWTIFYRNHYRDVVRLAEEGQTH